MLDRQPDGDQAGEGEVLRQVAGESGECSPNGQPNDPQSSPVFDLGLPGVAQPE
jgi:hypothetical protein